MGQLVRRDAVDHAQGTEIPGEVGDVDERRTRRDGLEEADGDFSFFVFTVSLPD
jgi:hypothetical protein